MPKYKNILKLSKQQFKCRYRNKQVVKVVIENNNVTSPVDINEIAHNNFTDDQYVDNDVDNCDNCNECDYDECECDELKKEAYTNRNFYKKMGHSKQHYQIGCVISFKVFEKKWALFPSNRQSDSF